MKTGTTATLPFESRIYSSEHAGHETRDPDELARRCGRSVTKTETKILGVCGKELSLAGFDDLAKEAYMKMDDFTNVMALYVKNQVRFIFSLVLRIPYAMLGQREYMIKYSRSKHGTPVEK